MSPSSPCRAVVALGGNAISRSDDDSVEQDYANLTESLASVAELVAAGYEVVLTHGNGPQVGNQMLRVELARGQAPDLPLDLVVADLQGGLGYMIERVLGNELLRRGLEVPVCAMLTLVEVETDDPAFDEPTKYVGRAFAREEARQLAAEHGWQIRRDGQRGYRRVVASPQPQRIVEKDLIRSLIDIGAVVIVGGGGGIPVARDAAGLLHGVEAVIDKDLVGAVLSAAVDAEELFILTDVEQVMLDYGTEHERPLGELGVATARRHLADGQFPAGSMGPKVEAACRFVEGGGRGALITNIFTLHEALAGRTGTWLRP